MHSVLNKNVFSNSGAFEAPLWRVTRPSGIRISTVTYPYPYFTYPYRYRIRIELNMADEEDE